MIPTNLLPEGTNYCIAGGFAACPALAQDKDVWVFASEIEPGDAGHRREELLKHLTEQGFEFEAEDETRNAHGYEGMIDILKVATIRTNDIPIHLLVTTADSVFDLMESFDISTHQIALTPEGRVVRGSQFTSVTESPVKLRDTPTTDARMVKISQRYGLEVL